MEQETEWDEIQRKFGNLPPKELVIEEESLIEAIEETAETFTGERKYEGLDLDELDSLDVEEDEERLLQQIRRQRLEELQQRLNKEIYGTLIEVHRRDDFSNEVTNVTDTPICVFLYQPRVMECEIMESALKILANKFKKMKFVKILSTTCIPNYPNSLVPTLLIYQEGKVIHKFVGLDVFGGKRLTPDDIEWELAELGVIKTTLDESPHTTIQNRVFLNIQRK